MRIVVIYHKADYDGIFCREIVKNFFQDRTDVDYIGWDYGDPVPDVPPENELFILDLSVEGLMSHPQLVWIDHHKSAIDRYSQNLIGYRIDGVAACRLAWQWFHEGTTATKEDFMERRVKEPLAVRLAGEYDIWDRRDETAELFQYGLDSLGEVSMWEGLLTETPLGQKQLVHYIVERGRVAGAAIDKRNETVAKMRTFRARFEGINFLCLNTARCNSLTFTAGIQPGDEALMGFYWKAGVWKISLYGAPHRPDVDLAAIAVRFGGGGHKQACGFEYQANFPERLQLI